MKQWIMPYLKTRHSIGDTRRTIIPTLLGRPSPGLLKDLSLKVMTATMSSPRSHRKNSKCLMMLSRKTKLNFLNFPDALLLEMLIVAKCCRGRSVAVSSKRNGEIESTCPCQSLNVLSPALSKNKDQRSLKKRKSSK